MKKIVQIVTIPLDKETNFGIFKDVDEAEIILATIYLFTLKSKTKWAA